MGADFIQPHVDIMYHAGHLLLLSGVCRFLVTGQYLFLV